MLEEVNIGGRRKKFNPCRSTPWIYTGGTRYPYWVEVINLCCGRYYLVKINPDAHWIRLWVRHLIQYNAYVSAIVCIQAIFRFQILLKSTTIIKFRRCFLHSKSVVATIFKNKMEDTIWFLPDSEISFPLLSLTEAVNSLYSVWRWQEAKLVHRSHPADGSTVIKRIRCKLDSMTV
jgi:hypothetical protein